MSFGDYPYVFLVGIQQEYNWKVEECVIVSFSVSCQTDFREVIPIYTLTSLQSASYSIHVVIVNHKLLSGQGNLLNESLQLKIGRCKKAISSGS